jgi:N-acetylmuramoyl-L-alanine amidase
MTPFAADPLFPVDVVASPNHGERRSGARPEILLLHYTGMRDAREALARLCTPEAEVSAHYLVFEDGAIAQMVAEARRAWHAGAEPWAGVSDVNSRSIGIEIANPGHDYGYPEFPAAQIDAVIALCRDVIARHGIRAERVLAHSDIAPLRKQDPGEKFPWRTLFEQGVGHWTTPDPPVGSIVGALRTGASGPEVRNLQQALAAYGYGIAVDGRYEVLTEAVVRAFQRHFRPDRVDGVADVSTVATLRRLQAALPGKL